MVLIKTYPFLLFLFLLFLIPENVKTNTDDDKRYIGLSFRSFETAQDYRTSLNLVPGKPVYVKNGFSVNFQIKLHKTAFGHIFRIIFNDSCSLDMFAFVTNDKISFVLNNSPKKTTVSDINLTDNKVVDSWANISVSVNSQFIECIVNKHLVRITNTLNISKIDKFFFGANKYKSFYTSDVARMIVKNIIIKDKNGKNIRNWSLSKHGDQVVYDHVDSYPALVENGLWEIDKRFKWKKELGMIVTQSFPQIATDTISKRVFVATIDSLFILNIKRRTIERIKVEGGKPFLGPPNYMIYNHITNQLIAYNVNQSEFITYDFKLNRWSDIPRDQELYIQHHGRFIDKKDNKLVLFGGYGHFKYNSILSTHDLNGGNWSTVDLSKKINPRYLSSLGDCGDGTFLLFGGFGSESGMQEQGPHNFYDLFKIDVNTKSCVKLGEVKRPNGHYAFSGSMVISKNKFYTLAYKNDCQKSNIKLFEIDSKTLYYKIYEDSIPYSFLDRDSNCDLYLTDSTSLYAVIIQRDIGATKYEVFVYSLAFPPVFSSEILQQNANVTHWQSILIILFGTITLILITLLKLKFIKRGKFVAPVKSVFRTIPVTPSQIEKTHSSGIYLLGTFQAIDKEGNDISILFTLKIRQLLTLCMLESFSYGNGLKSKRLEELIWFDFDQNNARNNRNVNISKLRLLLLQIGNISIIKENDFWVITIGDDCICDFKEVTVLLKEAKQLICIDKEKITQILRFAKTGDLLPDFNFEWIDKYKSFYSGLLLEILMKAVKQKELSSDYKLLIDICDVIFIHDKIDEDAIHIKCYSLYKLGQKGIAKQCFDKFCSDYKIILNEPPKLKFENIIGSFI